MFVSVPRNAADVVVVGCLCFLWSRVKGDATPRDLRRLQVPCGDRIAAPASVVYKCSQGRLHDVFGRVGNSAGHAIVRSHWPRRHSTNATLKVCAATCGFDTSFWISTAFSSVFFSPFFVFCCGQ